MNDLENINSEVMRFRQMHKENENKKAETNKPKLKPWQRETDKQRQARLVASLKTDIASRVAPPKVVGEFYIRADGHWAKGKDGNDLRWVDDETEKQLLKEMLAETFKAAGLSHLLK
jgi:hypothetical protein